MNRKVFIFLTICIIVYYFRSFYGYFQKDEWTFFSIFLPYTRDPLGVFRVLSSSVFEAQKLSGAGHLQPLYSVLWFLQNQLFGLSFLPYIISSITVHIINSCLMFKVILELTKNRRLAFIGGIFFATLATHQEAVTWVNAIPSALSVTGSLFSLLALLRRNNLWSVFWLAVALLTKETAVVMFPIIALTLFLYYRKQAWQLIGRYYLPLGVLYIAIRALMLLLYPSIRPILPMSSAVWPPMDSAIFLFRTITTPLKMLVEVFVPSSWILSFVERITPLAYPQFSDVSTFIKTAGSDMVIYILAVIMLWLFMHSVVSLHKQKYFPEANSLIIGMSLLLFSAFPIIFISIYSPRFGYETFIESRHLYFAAIGAALIFPVILEFLVKRAVGVKVTGLVLIGTLFLWSSLHFVDLQKQLSVLVKTGTIGLRIIGSIMETIPPGERKLTILFTSTKEYYRSGRIPPFKTNLAQVIAVHLFARHQVPFIFSTTDYWTKHGVAWQGYLTQGEYSLGYYYQKQVLMDAVKRGEVPVESIHAFLWDGTTETLTKVLW